MDSRDVSVGVDVSKDTLEVAVLVGRQVVCTASLANDQQGAEQLVKLCKQHRPQQLVMEATGGWEQLAAAKLAAAGLPVAIVNPRQVRRFAQALGRLAKTDQIDAQVLAQFGQSVPLPRRPLPEEKVAELREKLLRRDQLIRIRTAESHRLATCRSQAVRQSIQTILAAVEEEVKRIEQELDQWIRQSPLWQEQVDLLVSVPGVGHHTAYRLIAMLPELGQCSRQQIAALVGVAPLNRDSGKFRGQRTTWGGRGNLRWGLYLAALTATRTNPVIRRYYQRLLAAGKLKKVAIVACMRKLLTILNAIMREGRPWQFNPVAD